MGDPTIIPGDFDDETTSSLLIEAVCLLIVLLRFLWYVITIIKKMGYTVRIVLIWLSVLVCYKPSLVLLWWSSNLSGYPLIDAFF